MAQRRMFSKKITDTDLFLDMPLSAQALYLHLNMDADDDGFVGNPKTIKRKIGASDDDLKLLVAKQFLLSFESGVVVIKDWKVNNFIRNDRYQETFYLDEKSQLNLDESGSYLFGIPMVDQMDTQVRLGKDSIGKVSLGEVRTTGEEDDDRYVLYGRDAINDVFLKNLNREAGEVEMVKLIELANQYELNLVVFYIESAIEHEAQKIVLYVRKSLENHFLTNDPDTQIPMDKIQ